MMIMMMVWSRRRGRDDDDISNSSIIYNIEQDSVSISPSLEKHIQVRSGHVSYVTCPLSRVTCQDILRHDDLTGLLGPSLAALKCAHGVTLELSATGQLVLTNTR